MPMSPYLRKLRDVVGHDLLLLPSVTAVVLDAEDRMLLVQSRDDGRWMAPGGIVDPEENPADAVLRELWEETGLVGRVERLLGVFGGRECSVAYPNGDRASYVMCVFQCSIVGGALQQSTDETLAAAYLSARELALRPVSPWIPRLLPRFLALRHEAAFDPPAWRPPAPASDT